MNEHHIGHFRRENLPNSIKYASGHVKQGLLVLHDGQVVIRRHPESLQHLIQHLPVLSRDAHNGLQGRAALQLLSPTDTF